MPVSIESDPTFPRLVDLVADETLQIVDRQIDGDLRRAFRDVLAAWPVDTGTSRRELRFVRGDTPLTWGVRGDAPYTGAIVPRGETQTAASAARTTMELAFAEAVRRASPGGPGGNS